MNLDLAKSIATTLHAVFCPLNHEDDVLAVNRQNETLCKWYVESQCEKTWDRPSHREWLIHALIFIKTLESEKQDTAAIEALVLRVLEISRIVMDMRLVSEKAENQIMKLLINFYVSRES